MALTYLGNWSPFRVDALGLVTILGANEVDRAVGRLTRSCLTDWLPLLGAYTVASNQVTDTIPGFTLYNITDGIAATDISGWFGRWVLCQDLAFSASTVRMSVDRRSHPRYHANRMARNFSSLAIGILFIVPTIALSVLIGDWWGLANSISMAVSVFVRRIVISANTEALDRAATDETFASEDVKVFLTTPSGKGLTIFAPRVVIINCLLTTPRPKYPLLYKGTRSIGWLVFGAHVISLGMSSLLIQILSTFVILMATVAIVQQLGSREDHIGTRLLLEKIDVERNRDFRAAAYARLQLSEKEEESMLRWNLFPHKSNQYWWTRYRSALENGKLNPPKYMTWNKMLAVNDPKELRYTPEISLESSKK